MPYKDKQKQKESNKLASQRHRQKGMTQQGMTGEGMTGEGMTGEGMTRIEFIQQALGDDSLVQGIEAAAKRFNDREARYERAYRYYRWHKGEKIEPAIPYALTLDRLKLEKIHQSLKDHNVLKEIRYGVRGPMFDVVGDLLEATQ